MTKLLLKAVVPLALTLGFFAGDASAEAGRHVVAELEWRGASAEELRAVVLPLSFEFVRAEIVDGRATLYFESTKDEVEALLKRASRDFPAALKQGRVASVRGGIPKPSVPIGVKQLAFQIERDRLATMGISPTVVAAKLQELRGNGQLDQFVAGKAQVVVASQNGAKVLLQDLVQVELTEVQRPLIISQQDGPQQ